MNATPQTQPLPAPAAGLIAFNVWVGRRLIDTVFYSSSAKVDCAEVRSSLINHDGYSHEIVVRRARR